MIAYKTTLLGRTEVAEETMSSEMFSTHVGSLRGPIYYLAGPPTMVAGACRTLCQAGVDQDDIRTEEFAGY